jgi:hypothetical protein
MYTNLTSVLNTSVINSEIYFEICYLQSQ